MSGANSPQGGLTRRSFLKTTGAVAGAAVVAGAAAPTLTALAEENGPQPKEETVYYSTCRGNCGSRCPHEITVREGKVVKVAAAQMDEAFNDDYRRICVRGYSQPQRLYDPDRIKYPMRRVEGTERGAGQWERISWDEAFDEVAQKMKAAYEEYGGSSIAFWNSYACTGIVNGSGKASVAYGRFLSRTGATIFGPGADWAQMWFVYANTLFLGDDIKDTKLARTVICWGGNPTDAYPQDWQGVCQAKEAGARIITIDPQFTVAAAHSDMYVPILPGTDGALVLAMANYIIDNKLVNEQFMKDRTVSPLLIKPDGTYLRAVDLGEPLPMEIDPDDPRSAAMALQASPIQVWDSAVDAAVSVNEAVDPVLEGTFTVNGIEVQTVYSLTKEKIKDFTVEMASKECDIPQETIEELARIYATEGPVYVHTNQGLGHHVNSHHVYKNLMLLASLTGNVGVHGATPLGHAAIGFGNYAVDPSEFADGTEANLDICGMYLPDIVETGKWNGSPLEIRVLWCANGNPLCNESGRLELIDAVKKIDYVVSADCTMTDTVAYSDIVLPIPHVYEVNDVETSCFTPYIAFEHKVVEPAFECKTDLEIMREVASRMGMPELYDKTEEEYMKALMDTPSNIANNQGYDAFKEGRLVKSYTVDPDVVFLDTCAGTKTGRPEYYLETPFVRNNFGQKVNEYERYPYYERANESYQDNPLRDKYPLFGLSQHEKYHVHSQLAFTPVLRELEPEPVLKISADDAAARGIEQGDLIRAYNDHGSCVLRAKVTKGIKPGVISIPHGWREDQYVEGHAQNLTNRYMNDFCSNSAFYDFLCEVEKYEGGAQ